VAKCAANALTGRRFHRRRQDRKLSGVRRHQEKNLRLAFALLGLAFLAAAPASAEPADPHDVAAITACLKAKDVAKAQPESCVSIVANACFGGDEDAIPSAKVVQCLDREQTAWDQLLNSAFTRLNAHLDGAQQIKLRDLQRSWIVARKQGCEFFYDYFQGTMANPMIASCMNRETARRAIFLEIFAHDAEYKK
jgi:uncharacterized protein YecT (DUF1311 family)